MKAPGNRFILAALIACTIFPAFAHKTGGNQPPTPAPPTQHQSQGQSQGQHQGQGQSQTSTSNASSSSGSTSSAQGGNATAIGGAAGDASTTVAVSQQGVRNLPPAYAPNVYPTAPCVVGTSAGGTRMTFGLSFGISHRDKDCTRRETARTLASLGEVVGAIAVMCQDKAVYKAMRARCDDAASGVIAIVPIDVAPLAPLIKEPAVTKPAASSVKRKPIFRQKRKSAHCK